MSGPEGKGKVAGAFDKVTGAVSTKIGEGLTWAGGKAAEGLKDVGGALLSGLTGDKPAPGEEEGTLQATFRKIAETAKENPVVGLMALIGAWLGYKVGGWIPFAGISGKLAGLAAGSAIGLSLGKAAQGMLSKEGNSWFSKISSETTAALNPSTGTTAEVDQKVFTFKNAKEAWSPVQAPAP